MQGPTIAGSIHKLSAEGDFLRRGRSAKDVMVGEAEMSKTIVIGKFIVLKTILVS